MLKGRKTEIKPKPKHILYRYVLRKAEAIRTTVVRIRILIGTTVVRIATVVKESYDAL